MKDPDVGLGSDLVRSFLKAKQSAHALTPVVPVRANPVAPIASVTKFIDVLHRMIDLLETLYYDYQVHNRIGQFYYMQKAAELRFLSERIDQGSIYLLDDP